jgi:predicted RNase H-like nuclease (RuvC/YqgF family)
MTDKVYRYKNPSSTDDELVNFEEENEELYAELRNKKSKISRLTQELDDLSKVCANMDAEIKEKNSKIESLEKAAQNMSKMWEGYIQAERAKRVQPAKEMLNLKRFYVFESKGKMPESAQVVYEWLKEKMWVDGKIPILESRQELSNKSHSLYYFIRSEVPPYFIGELTDW